LFFGAQSAHAAAGSVDATFGNNGITTTNVPNTNGIVNSILLQSDGKILVFVGDSTVLRYTSSGLLDADFGADGIQALATSVDGSLGLQPNGQIVIGGVVTPSTGGAELGVERLNPSGSGDSSFGSNGLAVVSLGTRSPNVGNAALIYPTNDPNGGDILVCTTLISAGRRLPYQTALARFTPSGSLDTTFGNQGLSIQTGVNGCTAMALLATGDILVVNSEAVAQFTSSGGVRSAVTGGTIVATSQSSSTLEASTFDASGDYLLGGEMFVGEESRGHNSSAQVQRFTQTGTEADDATFHYSGAGGSGIEALVQGLAAQANGNIVAVGSQITFAQSGMTSVNGVARLQMQNGSLVLDPTFGNGGTIVNNLPASSAVVIQPDGNIVTVALGGNNSDLTLVRYLGQ
jgi:uncharacterized delta-60 repeat protein